MLTHKTIFTRTRPTVTIGVAEIAMMLLIQGMVTNGGLEFFMKATFRAVVGNGRRGISSRITRLDTATSRRVGARRTTMMMVLSGVLRLRNGEEGRLVPKGIVGGKLTMVGKRGNATDTRTDGLQTTKMTTSSQRRTDLGSLGLVGILVGIKPTAANAAVVDREKRKERRIIRTDNNDSEATRTESMTGGGIATGATIMTL